MSSVPIADTGESFKPKSRKGNSMEILRVVLYVMYTAAKSTSSAGMMV